MRMNGNCDLKFRETPFISSGMLTDKQEALVDQALIFNEGIRQGRVNNYKMAEALSKLNFSDKTAKHAEKLIYMAERNSKTGQGLQFSDILSPAIGNQTFMSLNMLVQEVGSSMEKDTLLSLAFPDKNVPAYQVMLDRIVGNTGISPEFGGDSDTLPVSRPLDTYGLTYEPGLWGSRCPLTAKNIMFFRERGVTTFEQRGIGQLVAYNSVNIVTQQFTRKNYLLNQAIFNNGFTYAGTNITSNIPSGNFIALDSMGTLNTSTGAVTYANADPLYNPLIAITNVLNNPAVIKYHSYIRGIICNDADLMAILNHPNVRPTINALAMGSLRENKSMTVLMNGVEKEIGTYYAPGFMFPFLSDRETWQEENASGTGSTTNNYFVERGSMFLLMDLTSFGGQLGAFHLTYNEVDPNVESPAMGLFTGVFNRNLENSNTVNRLDVVGSISGAPAVYMPESIIVLNNLYSNI